jgi:predicted TIM-barrel fold metal-dependent hydrolase
MEAQFLIEIAGLVFDGDQGGGGQLQALTEGYQISHERLLYGSDFPFTQTRFAKAFADRMKHGLDELFGEKERDAVYCSNSVKLLTSNKMRNASP